MKTQICLTLLLLICIDCYREHDDFFNKMHNPDLLEKDPIYQEIFKKHLMDTQRGVSRNIFKRVAIDFLTYNLKLTQVERSEYVEALDLLSNDIPDYIPIEDFSYYLNETKFVFILDDVREHNSLKRKDGL